MDETGYLIDEVNQLLRRQPNTQPELDATMIYRPKARPLARDPVPTPPEEDAFELDIHYEDEETAPPAPVQPQPDYRSVKAYNSDYAVPKAMRRDKPEAPLRPQMIKPKKRSEDMATPARPQKKRKSHPILLTLVIVLVALLLIGALLWVFFPKRPDETALKKGDVATVLLAGTDKDGTRTDTMMLLYIDRDAQQVNLLSLPRDLLTYVDGNAMKLNAAYGYGGCGERGMETLMDEMRDRIGFRPDGYILLDFEAVEQLIDDMGGITFDVPCNMEYSDPAQGLEINLAEGTQKLNGEQALWVLRYRSGYALADLKRVEVQRDLLKAAMEQWSSAAKLPTAAIALLRLTDGATTDLSTRNLAWIGKAICTIGVSEMRTATLPGQWNSPYYYPAEQEGASLLNESFNPTTRTITSEDVGY